MLEKLNNFPVNWVDGMKINKSHFIAMQDHTTDLVRDIAGTTVTPVNYGLLPYKQGDESVKISLVIDNHKMLRVKLEECHAITPNGSRIEISSKSGRAIDLEMPYPEASYKIDETDELVLLANVSVNPFEKIPFGDPDPEENPPRYPYVAPSYHLNLALENEAITNLYGGYQITIGKIVVKKNETYLVADYIPPSTSVNSHPNLINIYTEIDKFFGQLELFTVQIAQKISRRNQSNELAQVILNLSDKIITHLGYEITSFRWYALYLPPVYMFNKIVSLGRIMKNFIDSKSGAGKEELLNYFSEWCGIAQSEFEVMFTELVNVGYNHAQIDKTVTKILYFVRTIEELFSILNRLDYIGKRKDATIFVKEKQETEIATAVEKPKRTRTFLED